jgi:uncharacterized membrane protein YuzA (DUF378 family)
MCIFNFQIVTDYTNTTFRKQTAFEKSCYKIVSLISLMCIFTFQIVTDYTNTTFRKQTAFEKLCYKIVSLISLMCIFTFQIVTQTRRFESRLLSKRRVTK